MKYAAADGPSGALPRGDAPGLSLMAPKLAARNDFSLLTPVAHKRELVIYIALTIWEDRLMISNKRLFAAGVVFALASMTACAEGPSQNSLRIDRHYQGEYPYSNGGGRVYALPRGIISLSLQNEALEKAVGGDNFFKLTISAPSVSYAPDRDARYLALWNEAQNADDTFTFETDANGLLKSSVAINQDQTPAIVDKVAQIVKESAVTAARFGAGENFAGTEKETEKPPSLPREPKRPKCLGAFSFNLQIDPFRKGKTGMANECFDVKVTELDGHPLYQISSQEVQEIADSCGSAVCLRLPKPVLVSISKNLMSWKDVKGNDDCGCSATYTEKTQKESCTALCKIRKTSIENSQPAVDLKYIVYLPNPWSLAKYDITRGPCIKRENTLAFTNGMLVKAELKKPSEILQCLDIPLSFVKRIGEIPGAILTAKVEVINSEKGVVQAQSQYFEAMAGMIRNQNALLQAIAAKQ